MHDRLLVIDVHAVVRDKDAGRRAVAFGIDELVERVDGRAAGPRELARCPGGPAAPRNSRSESGLRIAARASGRPEA